MANVAIRQTFELAIFDLDGTAGRFAARHRRGAQPHVAGARAASRCRWHRSARTWAMARPGWCSARCRTGFAADALARLVADFRTQYARACASRRVRIRGSKRCCSGSRPRCRWRSSPTSRAIWRGRCCGSCSSTATSRTSSATATATRASRRPTPGAGCSSATAVMPRRALVVGDGVPDMRFARALGARAAPRSAGVTSRANASPAENPTWTVDRPADLVEIALASARPVDRESAARDFQDPAPLIPLPSAGEGRGEGKPCDELM